jgi:hypothetical protein
MNITNLIEAMYKRATPVRRMGPGTVQVVIKTPEGDKAIARVELDKAGLCVRLVPAL